MKSKNRPIPVILDTDIGGDIDDTWAVAMMARSPELDVKLAVSARKNTADRAKLIARLLEIAGRSDIAVGAGVPQPGGMGKQKRWVADYDLADYPGTFHPDGVEATIRTIMDAPEPVTLICIGQLTNIGEALRREPGIPERADFVAMLGHIIEPGQPGGAEYNVHEDIPACQKTLSAPWRSLTITPINTCGKVRLKGERYQRLRNSDDPLVRTVIENYRMWGEGNERVHPDRESSVLFDTVAIYLAFAREYLEIERMGVRVADDGRTVRDPSGPQIDVAIRWRDLDGFKDFLTQRMLGEV